MTEIIAKQDTPVVVVHDPLNPHTPFIIVDVKGAMRAQFTTQREADAFAETVNAEPALKQEDTSDTSDERDLGDREQQKEDDMPRGIPKVKAAAKKRVTAAKSKVKKRVAAAVKKTAKKVTSKVAKKAKKRATKFKY